MKDIWPNGLRLLPEHTGVSCPWCQVVRRHLKQRQQHNFRKLLMGLMVAALVAVLVRTL